ncbi:Hypothetical Protein RSKD131_1035 [Cereibacter sphaeroides KD131]|nr:Hypothetical Protein RSKD131_1035 [Cereibacter sphaeroides KD131]
MHMSYFSEGGFARSAHEEVIRGECHAPIPAQGGQDIG